jgi:hypothetical protein
MAEETIYYVVDTRATLGPRTHEMINAQGRIISYTFKDFVTATPVPHSHAMKFASIPGFECYDDDQNRIEPKTVKGFDGKSSMTLRADECIAAYDELTVDALRARCLKLPGIDVKTVTHRSRREVLIAMLVKAGKPKFQETDPDEDDDLIDADADDDDDAPPPAPIPVETRSTLL